jgi:hypothetical protein
VDMADIAEFDKAGPGASTSKGAFAHEVKEQQKKAEAGFVKGDDPNLTKGAAGPMHKAGILAENSANGNTRKEYPDGTNIFTEKDGTKTSQTVNPQPSGVATVTKTKIP